MKKWFLGVVYSSFVGLVLAASVSAAEPVSFYNGVSLQGFTGILNTPNAHVTDEGWLDALYTNQKDSQWRQKPPFQDNYLFSLGFFNFIELGGRFFEAPNVGRDLSGNFKLSSAALTRNLPHLPVLGAGIQDAEGGGVFLKTKYVVVSEDLWRLRLSAGYGTGPNRMKGAFGGGELKAHDWVYLLGEYDTRETNLGVRVVLPQFWKIPVQFTATAKTSLNYKPGNFDIAAGFSLPLDFRMRKPSTAASAEPATEAESSVGSLEPAVRSSKPAVAADVAPDNNVGKSTAKTEPVAPEAREEGRAVNEAKPRISPENTVPPPPLESTANLKSQKSRLARLRDSLIGAGFLNVRVGTRERALMVEYENTKFNHNELDALGLVAGLACQAAPEEIDTLHLVIKRRDIRTAMISVPLAELRTFLAGQGGSNLRDHLVFDFDSRQALDAEFLEGFENPGLLNTSLMLAPGLTTFIGTENGAFDYLLSIKPVFSTELWKGATAMARWDLPVSWSGNLDDGKPYRSTRHPAQMERLMLFQAVHPLPSVMFNLGGGMVVHDRYGVLNEAVWNPGGGEHQFRGTQGWTQDGTTHLKSDVWLGSYRYYYGPLDLSLEGTAGRFWSEDDGFSLELKRFWRDTAVSVYFKDTKGPDHKTWKAVGLQFSFPLTPRGDMEPIAKLQVRGSDEWSYAQESTLKNNNLNQGHTINYLSPYPLAIDPLPEQALYRSFYNRDRLNQAYILQHLDSLREAWQKYGSSLPEL